MAEKKFEENFKKLEQIVSVLQENRLSVDDLVPKMKEAIESLKICKEVLKETKVQIVEMKGQFEDSEK